MAEIDGSTDTVTVNIEVQFQMITLLKVLE